MLKTPLLSVWCCDRGLCESPPCSGSPILDTWQRWVGRFKRVLYLKCLSIFHWLATSFPHVANWPQDFCSPSHMQNDSWIFCTDFFAVLPVTRGQPVQCFLDFADNLWLSLRSVLSHVMIYDALQLLHFIYLFRLQWAVKVWIYTSVLRLFLASASLQTPRHSDLK